MAYYSCVQWGGKRESGGELELSSRRVVLNQAVCRATCNLIRQVTEIWMRDDTRLYEVGLLTVVIKAHPSQVTMISL